MLMTASGSRWWPLLGVVILLAVFFGMNIGADFGGSGLTTALAVYSELFAFAWEDIGFRESLGVPMISCVGETVAERDPYLHQPPVGWWPMYLGRWLVGKGPSGLRLFPLLFTVLAGAMVYRLVRGAAGAGLALLAVATFLLMPVIQLYGGLPGIEPATMGLGLLLIAAWLRHRATRRRHDLIAIAGWFVLGALISWQFYFFAPGLLLAELLLPRAERRIRLAMALVPLGAVVFVFILAHLTRGCGSLDAVVEAMMRTARGVASDGVGGRLDLENQRVGFFDRQPELFRTMLGQFMGPLMILGTLVAVASRNWRRDPLTTLLIASLVQGALSIIIFNGRSTTHDYYWFPMAIPAAIGFIQLVRWLRRGRSLRFRFRDGVVVALLLVVPILGARDVWPTKLRFESDELKGITARILDPAIRSDEWICMPDAYYVGMVLYSQRRWAPPLHSIPHLQRILDHRRQDGTPFRRLVYIIRENERPLRPELFQFLDRTRVATFRLASWEVFYL